MLGFAASTWAQNQKTIVKRIEKINSKIEETWVGTLHFYDDTELTCQFTLNTLHAEGVLLVKTDSTTNLLGVNEVKAFSFYDDDLGRRRHFYALPVKQPNYRKYFFELIHETQEISVLSRNSFSASNIYSRNRYKPGQKTNNPKVKKAALYYLLDHRDNEIYDMSKDEILRMTQDRKEEMTAFLNDRKFLFTVEDFISIVDYYCSIKATK
jgi:hypothetical protein